MHVGVSTFFQNPSSASDRVIYEQELATADMIEPLGFESIWAAEHHFSNYTMCPNVTQFLTYMAGRTSKVKLGSMVMVLPWHNPIRVAEEFCVLDQVSNGRAILGIGRGLGRIEFDGFGVDMNESRERFVEYSEALFSALETGLMEYQGRLLKQPPVQIRPRSFASFRGRAYASAVSPESAEVMARLGVGILIIAQKPWAKTVEELDNYRRLYREIHEGAEAPKPMLVSFTACHPEEAVANEMYRYIRDYTRSALNHYEFDNQKLAEIKGYEYYGALARNIQKNGIEEFLGALSDLQTWGTPKQVLDRQIDHLTKVGAGGLINIFSFGGMPPEMARESMKLYAKEVLPHIKKFTTS